MRFFGQGSFEGLLPGREGKRREWDGTEGRRDPRWKWENPGAAPLVSTRKLKKGKRKVGIYIGSLVQIRLIGNENEISRWKQGDTPRISASEPEKMSCVIARPAGNWRC